jgi:hypothetical protein
MVDTKDAGRSPYIHGLCAVAAAVAVVLSACTQVGSTPAANTRNINPSGPGSEMSEVVIRASRKQSDYT